MSSTQTVVIELSRPLETLTGLTQVSQIQGFVRLHGTPIGEIFLPVQQGSCSARSIAQAIFPHYSWAVCRELVRRRLACPELSSWRIADLIDLPPAPVALPSATVVFCIEGQSAVDPAHLSASLAALNQLRYPNLQCWVVEAQPQSDRWQQQIQTHYPNLRYGAVDQPGLHAARNWVINGAIKGALTQTQPEITQPEITQPEIIAFTDARGIVDRDWLIQIGRAFAEHPEIDALTGLVLTAGIETATQRQFEAAYSLGRGSERRWYRLDPTQPIAWPMLGTMQVGSGLNMAVRRRVFEQLGGFDPSLDQADRTGGDWELFARLLLAGKTLLYEPAAIVQVQIPATETAIRQRLTQEMNGFSAYLRVGMQRYPDLWLQFVSLGLWKLARLSLALLRSHGLPRAWTRAELQGFWQGVWQGVWRNQERDRAPQSTSAALPAPRAVPPTQPRLMAVRSIDLSQPLPDLTDVADYRSLRLFLNHGRIPIGSIDLEPGYQPVSAARLRDAIAERYLDLLALPHQGDQGATWTEIQMVFNQRWLPAPELPPAPAPLPIEIPVSIIITTCDRPADLANCLRHLQAQHTQRSVEIIVADNRPASGITPAVISQFAGVKLVAEARPGGSYGRNAAINASTGEIIVSVDDDVIVPPDWLEKLLAPLVRPEVMVVTGNVLPLELETPAQLMFETYKGGLGEGFQPFEVDRDWLDSFDRSPPTWDLGVSANAAFRAEIFSHPRIGLMDEVLGPGTPTVGGEENHLLYKVLRAGYTVVYEPAAYVWHRHRRDLPALYRQVYGHMKGGTAYHLLLWLQEQDRRGLRQLISEMPRYYGQHLIARLKGQHQTPWRLLGSEIAGYFAGFWGYWQSCQRVNRQGRSAPYVPVSQRGAIDRSGSTPDSVSLTVDPALDPALDPVPALEFTSPTADPIANPIANPIADPIADLIADPILSPITSMIAGPIAGPITGPIAGPIISSTPDQIADQAAETLETDPIAAPETRTIEASQSAHLR